MSNQPIPGKSEIHTRKPSSKIHISDYINFLFGESPALKNILSGVNWWRGGLALGLFAAIMHLILISNPGICYLFARDQVKGMEVSLPEAMASVNAWGWYNLILTPLVFIAILATAAYMIHTISRKLAGKGLFSDHLGMVVIGAGIILAGQLTGFIMINSVSIKGLMDLRDLTPGVGLGLLPFFTRERIGFFYGEVVRGFDLFGIWVILLNAAIFKAVDHFNRFKSFALSFVFYSSFMIIRWVGEGPGYHLWHYFWTAGNV